MKRNQLENKYILILALIGIIIGFFWVIQTWSSPLGQGGDEGSYYQLGQNLCHTNRFSSIYKEREIPTMSRAPLFPFIISNLCRLGFSSPNSIKIFNIALFIGIILLVYFNTRQIFNESISFLAALLTSVFPPIGFLTSRIHTEITYIFFLLTACLFLILLFKNKSIHFAILSGIFFGLSNLTRPGLILFPIFLIIVLFTYQKFKFTDLVKKSFIILIFFTLTISPWLLRNYFVFQEINITDAGGIALYGPAYRVSYYTKNQIKHHILLTIFESYLAKKIDSTYDYKFSKFEPHVYRRSKDWPIKFGPAWKPNLSEHQERKILFNEAKNLIAKHPFRYIEFSSLEIIKNFHPLLIEFGTTDLFANTHNELPDSVKLTIILSIKFAYLIFFILVFYGISLTSNKFNLILPILIIIVYSILLISSTGIIYRYIIPLYPFYFIFFSYAIIKLTKKYSIKITSIISKLY